MKFIECMKNVGLVFLIFSFGMVAGATIVRESYDRSLTKTNHVFIGDKLYLCMPHEITTRE